MIEIEFHISQQTVEIEKSRAENLNTEDIIHWCFQARIEFVNGSFEKTLLLLPEVSLFHVVDKFFTVKEQYWENLPIKIEIDDRYGVGMITKGIHVHRGKLEISLRPGQNGTIVFKPANAFARDNPELFNRAASDLQEELVSNEALRNSLIRVTTAARDTFTSGSNSARVNGMGAEFNFLLDTLRNIGQ